MYSIIGLLAAAAAFDAGSEDWLEAVVVCVGSEGGSSRHRIAPMTLPGTFSACSSLVLGLDEFGLGQVARRVMEETVDEERVSL